MMLLGQMSQQFRLKYTSGSHIIKELCTEDKTQVKTPINLSILATFPSNINKMATMAYLITILVLA